MLSSPVGKNRLCTESRPSSFGSGRETCYGKGLGYPHCSVLHPQAGFKQTLPGSNCPVVRRSPQVGHLRQYWFLPANLDLVTDKPQTQDSWPCSPKSSMSNDGIKNSRSLEKVWSFWCVLYEATGRNKWSRESKIPRHNRGSLQLQDSGHVALWCPSLLSRIPGASRDKSEKWRVLGLW